MAHNGPPSRRQWCQAALLYGGANALLSHRTAGALHGLRVVPLRVEILVPHGRHQASTDRVLVHQTNQLAEPDRRECLSCTTVDRAVVDIALTMRFRDDVRALLADAVQRRLTTVSALAAAAELAPRRGSRHLRAALEEVEAGARSCGEAEFLDLVRRAGLPEPELNAPVLTSRGTFWVDALWRAARVAVEIDGQAWHLEAAAWERDLRRQNLLIASGLTLLRFPVRRLRDDPDGVLREMKAALDRAAA